VVLALAALVQAAAVTLAELRSSLIKEQDPALMRRVLLLILFAKPCAFAQLAFTNSGFPHHRKPPFTSTFSRLSQRASPSCSWLAPSWFHDWFFVL
jgi:hypothetical protein